MNHKKPTPVIRDPARKVCPVCGKPSYSRDGIHPQCAVFQADKPRRDQLKAERNEEKVRIKALVVPNVPLNWHKACPKCGVEVHVRRKACDCGYVFAAYGA